MDSGLACAGAGLQAFRADMCTPQECCRVSPTLSEGAPDLHLPVSWSVSSSWGPNLRVELLNRTLQSWWSSFLRCQNSFRLCNRQLKLRRHPVGASWRKSKPCNKNGEGQESNQSRWEELISFHLLSSSVWQLKSLKSWWNDAPDGWISCPCSLSPLYLLPLSYYPLLSCPI